MFKIKDYVNKALSYNGYLEKKSNYNLNNFTANVGKNNYTRFNRDYGKYTGVGEKYWQAQPWCAMFVSVCLVEALKGDVEKAKEMLCGNLYVNVNTAYNAFKKQNRIFKEPKEGDLIFFYNSARTKYAHIGIVYKISGDTVYTIEGNTSVGNGVIANGGGVAKRTYKKNYKYIGGYGRLNIPEENEKSLISIINKYPKYKVIANKGLNVRKAPGTRYPIVTAIPKNTIVEISIKLFGWGYSLNHKGWLKLEYLKKI